MFRLRILDAEEGVVGAGEGGAGLLAVVVRESIRGIRVLSYIELGLGPRP